MKTFVISSLVLMLVSCLSSEQIRQQLNKIQQDVDLLKKSAITIGH